MNKKFTYLAAMAIAFGMTACGGQKKQEAEPVAETPVTEPTITLEPGEIKWMVM